MPLHSCQDEILPRRRRVELTRSKQQLLTPRPLSPALFLSKKERFHIFAHTTKSAAQRGFLKCSPFSFPFMTERYNCQKTTLNLTVMRRWEKERRLQIPPNSHTGNGGIKINRRSLKYHFKIQVSS